MSLLGMVEPKEKKTKGDRKGQWNGRKVVWEDFEELCGYLKIPTSAKGSQAFEVLYEMVTGEQFSDEVVDTTDPEIMFVGKLVPFDQHNHLCDKLQIPHSSGGTTVVNAMIVNLLRKLGKIPG